MSVNRGYFGIAIYRPKWDANVGTLARTANLYGAAFVATIGARYQRHAADTPNSPLHVPFFHYNDIQDFEAHLPDGCELVGVELSSRAESLPAFHHPSRVVYILGAEDDGLPGSVLDRCDKIIQIPSVKDWSMNVGVAGSIVVYDRFARAV